ncbi:MAG: FG-GAP repeat domain-containing protein [Cyclobacteriaceae bacterium]
MKTLIKYLYFLALIAAVITFSHCGGGDDPGPSINTSSVNYSESSEVSLEGVMNGSVAFSDIDNDDDQDLLITGAGKTILYSNDGAGNYTRLNGTQFPATNNGKVIFADVDNNNSEDVLIMGDNVNSSGSAGGLFINNGSGNFSISFGSQIDILELSSFAFADIDNDNDNDLIVTGWDGSFMETYLYIGNGSGNFSLNNESNLDNIWRGSIAFADVDNDNDQDVVICGATGSGVTTVLYINDGSGKFTEANNNSFTGVWKSSIAFADIDGDNDQDLLITGEAEQPVTELYVNDGSGNFTKLTTVNLEGVMNGSIAFADVDKDNDLDVLITGESNNGMGISNLYANNGSGNFTLFSGLALAQVKNSSVAFADVNNDDNPDLLISGENNSGIAISKLYISQ